MQTTRSTRSSVLGKRAHRQQESFSSTLPITSPCDPQLQTPDPTPNPKRIRMSITTADGDSNKENVPPYSPESMSVDAASPRAARALRRTNTELITTPSRSRTTRHASMASSPTTPAPEISLLAIATPPPTPHTALLSLHARARALLRSTCNNDNTEVAGRGEERAIIQQFLASFLDSSAVGNDVSTSLYISGSPGSGKTALVNSILRSLETDAKIIVINCMALNSTDALWETLLEELRDGPKRKTARRAKKSPPRDAVEAMLSSSQSKCVVLLDELDHIAPNTRVLSSIFSLPNTTPSTLRLIGIANTHTLTSSSSSMQSITSASNVHTLHFAPYTPTQLHHILQSRLKSLYEPDSSGSGKTSDAKKFLPSPTLMLLTKKIAALTGDVRSLFEVLRGAIDLAIAASSPSTPSRDTTDDNPLITPSPSVSPTHILAALKAYTPSSAQTSAAKPNTSNPTAVTAPSTSNSEIVAKVHNLGLQARLVLLSILLGSKRLEAGLPLSGASSIPSSPKKKSPVSLIKCSISLPNPGSNINGVGIDPNQLHAYYSVVLDRTDSGVFEPVSRSEFGDLVGVLEGVGLISLAGGAEASGSGGARRAFGRSASFGGGAGFGGTGKGKGAGELRLAKGVRGEEVLRGMGVSSNTNGDVRAEEVRGIWEREKARLRRDMKALEREMGKSSAGLDAFDGAAED